MIHGRIKYTRINPDLIPLLQSFKITPQGKGMGSIPVIRERIDLTNLIKILYPIRYNPLIFSELYRRSDIPHYKTFQRYVRFCTGTHLITKKPLDKQKILYFITPKGTTLLAMFLS